MGAPAGNALPECGRSSRVSGAGSGGCHRPFANPRTAGTRRVRNPVGETPSPPEVSRQLICCPVGSAAWRSQAVQLVGQRRSTSGRPAARNADFAGRVSPHGPADVSLKDATIRRSIPSGRSVIVKAPRGTTIHTWSLSTNRFFHVSFTTGRPQLTSPMDPGALIRPMLMLGKLRPYATDIRC